MIRKSEKIIVGISIGDLNGIGGEVILKIFEDARMIEFCTPVIFANTKIFSLINKTIGTNISFHGIDSLDQLIFGKINVLNVWKENLNIEFGKEDEQLGKYAMLSFEHATKALKEGNIDVLVTAPINKHNVGADQNDFVGHTEYLSNELEGEALMLLTSEDLKVGLLTGHVPLKEVSAKLTEELIRNKVKILEQSLIQDFSIVRPKIAVLGLNPHCGDGGVIGDEDDKVLKPTIARLFEQGHLVFGPFSADGFFGSETYKKYDAVLASYHDQGLVPFKTIAFGQGVNFTAGLNKIRTSPDHGTAFDIAGKGIADFSSFREAVYLAIDIYNSRNLYREISANPLRVTEKQSESKK
ncbi:MAG TPA: 4-hydroxythreonine-4-phosphate dehydrogenase PdxA [Flavobacterium sp.]|nr:4-hydroxythreonine-4-phosphate dehydrogenase PdxA [Flavobacterium sp.]